MKNSTKNALINQLVEIPTLQERSGRDAWLERQLSRRLVDRLKEKRSNSTRDDITFIVIALDGLRLADGSLCINLLIHDVLKDLAQMDLDPRMQDRLLETSQLVETEADEGNRVPVGLDHSPGFEEVIIGVNEKVLTNFLLDGLQAGRSVGRVMVANTSGDRMNGTGWLIAPGLLITNYHVIKAQFGVNGPIQEDVLQRHALSLTATFGFTGFGVAEEYAAGDLAAFDYGLDYAVVRMKPTSRNGVPISNWGYLSLVPAQPNLPRGERLNIVQHPDGRVQEFALRSNYFVNHSEETHRLYYLSDTEGGSSGSPVLNDHWQVVALHRGWDYFGRKYHGQPITLSSLGLHYQGIKGMEEDAVAKINEGVAIHAIYQHLPLNIKGDVRQAQNWQ